ncbi:Enniatin synthase [Beauveria bassiana]|uniref:Enniatin synthase n=1 Tax=Beauveria bassiana TaxID=176275 RepID=A0A2N6NE95_BEABA|nr:Enniatin synthase [Beauveria bassiana]
MALEERHESLRTTFTQHDGVGLQVVQPFEPKKVEIVDMAGATSDALQQALHREQTTPFNLETEPGWRTSILRLGEEDHVLSIVMHHIITDGWSIGIIQRELAMFYSAACQGIEPLSQVRPLPIQYRDFAVWQRQEAQKAEHQRQLEYWKRQLDGSQPAKLLYDKPRPTILSGSARVHEFSIEGDLYQNLASFCKQHQVTVFSVLFTVFRVTHFRFTGAEDATIGIPIANRNRQELEDLVGFFVNLQCIRVIQVFATITAASAHQDVPFERIVAELLPGGRDPSRNPLVHMTFGVHLQETMGHIQLETLDAQFLKAPETARFDVEFHIFQANNSMHGSIIYSDELFDAVSIQSMVAVFCQTLKSGLEEPSNPVSMIPLEGELPQYADVPSFTNKLPILEMILLCKTLLTN